MVNRVSRFKRTIVIGSATALALGGAGVAFAYWSSTGIGTGEAQTDDASAAFIVESDAAEGTIAPGNPGQTVAFTVTNPSDGVLNLAAFTVSLADADGTPWVPAGDCLFADYTAAFTTPAALGDIDPLGVVTGEVTVTLANTAINQDDCQGQDVPLYFEAS